MSVPQIYTKEDVNYWRVQAVCLKKENERLRGALAQMLFAIKDMKNGNLAIGEFIDCANAILSRTAEQNREGEGG